MPLVNVMVASRAYTIACDEGEEEHLKELAVHVDHKAREVLAAVGQVGDARMMLMAALLIADEHHDLAAKAAQGSIKADAGSAERHALTLQAEETENAAAGVLEAAAKKIEDIAARLTHA